jgi:hypothetical protein
MPLARALSPGACAILAIPSDAFPGQASKYRAISSELEGASPRHLELSWWLEHLRLVVHGALKETLKLPVQLKGLCDVF